MSGVLRRKFLFWLNLLTVAPLAAVTLAGFAGGWWWGFDLFSHFRVQYAAVALVLFLLFFAIRVRASAWLTALLLAINLAPIALLYWPKAAAVESGASAQRVLMMNVYRGNPGIQRVLRYVRQENPDVLVLEEVTKAWVGPLKGLEARYPFRWVHPGDALTGIAVFSRSMPVQTRLINLGRADKPSLLLTLGVGPEGGQKLSILGTHFSPPVGAAHARVRNQELASLARIAKEHVWPLVVVGDLNITPFSPLFTRTLRDGGLKSCDGGGWHPTWPMWAPPLGIQIDHCLATEGVVTSDFRVGPSLGSDHRGFTVKISPVALTPAQ